MSSLISNRMMASNELTKVICSSGCHWFKWFSFSYSKSSALLLLPSSSSIMLRRITHAIIMSLSVSSFQNRASPRTIANCAWRNARHPNTLFPEFGSKLMCHNPMKLWHTFQNDRSHEIMTHQFGTKF
jgi:hypothetical protein